MSDHAHEGRPDFVAHHFHTAGQQRAAVKLGMWIFLVQEVLFFSGLFVAYTVFRYLYPGTGFANETGVKILEDPYKITMYGQQTLLSHGDILCIDDVQYQRVRKMVRDPNWQASMLAKPLKERLRIAQEARRQSLEQTINKSLEIMDVNQDEVKRVIREHNVDILLHGHTHRPDVHTVDLGNRKAKRIVLGDWYEQGSVVRWDSRGPKLEALPR